MEAVKIQEHARKLRDAHGEKAAAEAAQQARIYEQNGDEAQAKVWRRIEAALHEMRGPRAS